MGQIERKLIRKIILEKLISKFDENLDYVVSGGKKNVETGQYSYSQLYESSRKEAEEWAKEMNNNGYNSTFSLSKDSPKLKKAEYTFELLADAYRKEGVYTLPTINETITVNKENIIDALIVALYPSDSRSYLQFVEIYNPEDLNKVRAIQFVDKVKTTTLRDHLANVFTRTTKKINTIQKYADLMGKTVEEVGEPLAMKRYLDMYVKTDMDKEGTKFITFLQAVAIKSAKDFLYKKSQKQINTTSLDDPLGGDGGQTKIDRLISPQEMVTAEERLKNKFLNILELSIDDISAAIKNKLYSQVFKLYADFLFRGDLTTSHKKGHEAYEMFENGSLNPELSTWLRTRMELRGETDEKGFKNKLTELRNETFRTLIKNVDFKSELAKILKEKAVEFKGAKTIPDEILNYIIILIVGKPKVVPDENEPAPTKREKAPAEYDSEYDSQYINEQTTLEEDVEFPLSISNFIKILIKKGINLNKLV